MREVRIWKEVAVRVRYHFIWRNKEMGWFMHKHSKFVKRYWDISGLPEKELRSLRSHPILLQTLYSQSEGGNTVFSFFKPLPHFTEVYTHTNIISYDCVVIVCSSLWFCYSIVPGPGMFKDVPVPFSFFSDNFPLKKENLWEFCRYEDGIGSVR